MLLARQRPLAARFVKRTPLDAASAPKSRGFGARRKVVAAALKTARPAADDVAIATAAVETAEPPDWASRVDWLGAAAESFPPRPNGHAPEAFGEELPPPEAIPAPAPEPRVLN